SSGTTAGVADPDRHRKLAIGGHLGGTDAQVVDLERGVGPCEAEGEKRRRVHAANAGALSAAEWWLQVGASLTAGVPRDLHRQSATRRDPSGPHARDRCAALLAWNDRRDRGGGPARHVAKRVRTAGDDHDDDRR